MAETAPVTQPDYTDPSNSSVKSGHKTSEFYLTILCQILAALMVSGLFDPTNADHAFYLKLMGAAVALLSQLGYNKSRTEVKNQAIQGAVQIKTAEIGWQGQLALNNQPQQLSGPGKLED
jgi:hypothetical protein